MRGKIVFMDYRKIDCLQSLKAEGGEFCLVSLVIPLISSKNSKKKKNKKILPVQDSVLNCTRFNVDS